MPFRLKFSSMSESTQTSQADLCYLKTCSRFLFVCLFVCAGRKDKHRPTVLPLPPPPHCSSLLKKKVNLDTRDMDTLCYTANVLRFFNIIQEHRGRGGWGVGRLSCLFVKCFLPDFREKQQHRNIFSHHTGRLVKFGWILTENVTRNGTNAIVARSHSIVFLCTLCKFEVSNSKMCNSVISIYL